MYLALVSIFAVLYVVSDKNVMTQSIVDESRIPVYAIRKLNVMDTLYVEQIKSIISNTKCFVDQPKERNIVFLIHGSYDVVTVALGFDLGNDLEYIYGGFYGKIDNNTFLFVVDESEYIPLNVYELTEKDIDIKGKMNFTINYIDSDAEWYIKKDSSENKFQLNGTNCW